MRKGRGWGGVWEKNQVSRDRRGGVEECRGRGCSAAALLLVSIWTEQAEFWVSGGNRDGERTQKYQCIKRMPVAAGRVVSKQSTRGGDSEKGM